MFVHVIFLWSVIAFRILHRKLAAENPSRPSTSRAGPATSVWKTTGSHSLPGGHVTHIHAGLQGWVSGLSSGLRGNVIAGSPVTASPTQTPGS